MALTEGFRIVRVLRVPEGEKIYGTALAAAEARDKLGKLNPENSYAICHSTYPLDNVQIQE